MKAERAGLDLTFFSASETWVALYSARNIRVNGARTRLSHASPPVCKKGVACGEEVVLN
jgi:hypothetical protein